MAEEFQFHASISNHFPRAARRAFITRGRGRLAGASHDRNYRRYFFKITALELYLMDALFIEMIKKYMTCGRKRARKGNLQVIPTLYVLMYICNTIREKDVCARRNNLFTGITHSSRLALRNLSAPSNIIVVRKIYSLSALCHNYGGNHLSRGSDKQKENPPQMLIYADIPRVGHTYRLRRRRSGKNRTK